MVHGRWAGPSPCPHPSLLSTPTPLRKFPLCLAERRVKGEEELWSLWPVPRQLVAGSVVPGPRGHPSPYLPWIRARRAEGGEGGTWTGTQIGPSLMCTHTCGLRRYSASVYSPVKHPELMAQRHVCGCVCVCVCVCTCRVGGCLCESFLRFSPSSETFSGQSVGWAEFF